MRLHHVGVVTDNMSAGIRRHEALFNLHPITKVVNDTKQKVAVVLLAAPEGGDSAIELIAPLTEDSPVSNALKKGTHLYHLCFVVDDIEEAIDNARKQGAIVVSKPTEADLYGGKKIAFIYTRDKYLVEFLEK